MRSPRPDLGPLHPFNDAIVGVYLTGKEQAMHRRAKRAEGDLAKLRRRFEEERAFWIAQVRRLTNRERNQRKRANRLHKFVDEVERLKRERDPLYRIIAIGREFP